MTSPVKHTGQEKFCFRCDSEVAAWTSVRPPGSSHTPNAWTCVCVSVSVFVCVCVKTLPRVLQKAQDCEKNWRSFPPMLLRNTLIYCGLERKTWGGGVFLFLLFLGWHNAAIWGYLLWFVLDGSRPAGEGHLCGCKRAFPGIDQCGRSTRWNGPDPDPEPSHPVSIGVGPRPH